MSSHDKTPPPVKVSGQRIEKPPLPRFVGESARGSGAPADPFLPPGLVTVAEAFDLSTRARSAAPPSGHTIESRPGQVLVLELSEDVNVITTADRLRETLERLDGGVLEDGTLNLDALRERGTATRGWVGDAAGELVSRVFALDLGTDEIITAARRKAREWLGQKAEDTPAGSSDLGVSWIGTKALMWAIESRLDRKPGLYRWTGPTIDQPEPFAEDGDPRLEQDAKDGPLLVFIHGTASSTTGSFGDLPTLNPGDWTALASKFGDRVYAFEHRTFSESPIDNALALARALPAGAHLNVVTHSRGGLVGDLLCLSHAGDAFSDDLIDRFRQGDRAAGGSVPTDREREEAYAEHRKQLRALRGVLRAKGFRIVRYVRVASPARGTRLAGSHLDVFLSGLLALVGAVPYLAGNPLYSALKRIVLEIARNRTDPHLIPGIEAMLPDSPIARFLASAAPSEGMRLAVISGDIEGGGLLKRLGVLFTDFVFFGMFDNDLVVDTDSMYAGLARPGHASRRFEQGPKVSHFRYFENPGSRAALRDWLTASDLASVSDFELLPDLPPESAITLEAEQQRDASITQSRGAEAAGLPVAIVLPDIMGSHLWIKSRKDRVWFDAADLASGGLDKIGWPGSNVAAEKLLEVSYGNLCRHLLSTHRVERFAYDWRQPLDRLAVDFAKHLQTVLASTTCPVRIVAHGMGGLVVRALIATRPGLWDEVMKRKGARFVMLGTPNQGSHSMVATLLGKSDAIRMLARLDQKHDMQSVLDIVARFRGALQLLPRPEPRAAGQAPQPDYYSARAWKTLKEGMTDVWFGDRVAALPEQAWLNEGKWLWKVGAALPEEHKDKTVYVFGSAENTACGVKQMNGRWRLVGTPRGDGTVTWLSGRIDGIGRFYNMPVEHGALADSEERFPALVDLLERGDTERLGKGEPALRGTAAAEPVTYDAGPVPYPTGEEVARGLLGAHSRRRVKAVPELEVACAAMDLRFATRPVMVGHYQQDPISGAEALIDRELVANELTMRQHLGLYAGSVGTATVVLLAQNEEERLRGSYRGAVVVGLGTYGDLTVGTLTEAVRAGTLRYLLQLLDNRGGEGAGPAEAALSTLLLGYNSTTNISIEDSVGALVRGVLAANQQFAETMGRQVRVTKLELVELYLDTAISAARALNTVAERVNSDAARYGMKVKAARSLRLDTGRRQRLEALQVASYWPRLMVTDPDRREDERPEGDQTQPGPIPAKTALARRLKFVYLGSRARAETELQQTQPELVERLVGKSAVARTYSEDFSRSLFQILIPRDFKDAARQMDRVVLVVDGQTANVPWELMLADQKPLVVQTAMVRQLASPRYRIGVRQTLEALAYVVGNPSTDGFYNVFSGQPEGPSNRLGSLDGAEKEALAVAGLLKRHRYEVVQAIGNEQTGPSVINTLFRRSYRIIHIAAHGVYEQPTKDGSSRSGVVLSDGLLITAAEIRSMEVVPDLVFLNCCHLGKVSRGSIAFNKLAYSVARELIEMGVRAVVAAGWAVDDTAANLFAETFYARMLENYPFGDAVFEARKKVYSSYRTSNTWGAYQAYGDPGFVLNPRRESAGASRDADWTPVAPDEVIERLGRIQTDAASRLLLPGEARKLAERISGLVRACPGGENWDKEPQVAFALGQAYAELGSTCFDKARESYLASIGPEDKQGRAPIRGIEQLANLEARRGEETGDVKLVETALERLHQLVRTAAGPGTTAQAHTAGAGEVATFASQNPERAALIGSAYKRLAAAQARALILNVPGGSAEGFRKALRDSMEAYGSVEGRPADRTFKPYNALNRLALKAVLDFAASDVAADADVAVAQACAQWARDRYRTAPDVWNAVMPADAALTAKLLDRSLGIESGKGDEALEAATQKYADALAHVRVTPRELDSIVKQICLLALFYRAWEVTLTAERQAEAGRFADRLGALAEHVAPGACKDVSRNAPAEPGGGAAPPGGEAATPAESTLKRSRPARPRGRRSPPGKAAGPATRKRKTAGR